jgi:hypothetical protein
MRVGKNTVLTKRLMRVNARLLRRLVAVMSENSILTKA